MNREALRKAVIEQLQSAHLQRQVQRQLADVIAGKKVAGTIRVKLPMPPGDAKTDYAPNRNRGKKRFVLGGTQREK